MLRALRGRARPEVRPYRAHIAPSPGSQPGITPTTRGSSSPRPERARSAGSAPFQGAQCRARALSPGIPPRPAPGVFPAATGCNESRPASLAHSTTAGRSRSPTAMGRGASLRHGSLSARWHPSALERASLWSMVASSGIILIRRGSFVRALRGRARPGVRPYRAHNNAEPGITPTTRGSSSPRPERARSAGSAPLQGAHNAEPGLSARETSKG